MSPIIPHKIFDGVEKKRCGTCKKYLSTNNFWKCIKNWDELQARCKLCLKVYTDKNKEKIATKRRAYREKNKEKIQIKKRKYYEQNKAKISEANKKYRQQNRENC